MVHPSAPWRAFQHCLLATLVITSCGAGGLQPFGDPRDWATLEDFGGQHLDCAPPHDVTVAAARQRLDDFAVLEVYRGELVARAATQQELNDLAWFYASIRGAGLEVGEYQEAPDATHGFLRPAESSPRLDALATEIERARATEDPWNIEAASRAYLEELGYPEPLQTDRENGYAWGGARYAFVMRDLAAALEAMGQLDEAEHLYRRANPGGGACGTSVDYRWKLQVKGAIRTAERAGRCDHVIPERLLEIDGPSDPDGYGTRRLREAGFDLARLYRGALVTLNRDADMDDLERALAHLPGDLAPRALDRLHREGREDWARRIYALEGYADVVGAAAFGHLLHSAAHGTISTQQRALRAIGELARRPIFDPCAPGRGFESSWSSYWQREVRTLGRSCDTTLSHDQRQALATDLVALLGKVRDEIRAEVVGALGALASPLAVDALTRALLDPFVRGQRCDVYGPGGIGTGACVDHFPVRERAREALQRIHRFHP